jgi:uncharacterized membrane protein YqjE
MNGSLSQLASTVLRHLDGYREIVGADAREAAAALAGRMLAILLAAAAALISALMACVWVLALAWDGPWRTWTAAGLALAFAITAVGIAWPLLRRRSGKPLPLFCRVRRELNRDRDLLQRVLTNGSGDSHAAG